MADKQKSALDCGQINCKDKLLYSKNTAFSGYEKLKKLQDDGFLFEIFDSVDSTNLVLKQMAKKDACEKTVVIANEQTSGRGRLGRSFFSPADTGIYMSVLLKPDVSAQKAVNITSCAAVAVCRALKTLLGIDAQIKWVNDIYIDGKKVCGILTEAVFGTDNDKPEYVILGIGLNLYPPKDEFPAEITDIADSVLDCESLSKIDKEAVITQILLEFFKIYQDIDAENIYNEYKSRMFLLGKRVSINLGDGFAATIVDINRDFSLKVELDDGKTMNVNSGEISVRLISDKK